MPFSTSRTSDNLLVDYHLRDRPRRGERFIVEGRWPVEALLASELMVHSVLIVEGQHPDLKAIAARRAPVLECTRAEVEALVGFAFHRGVLACGERPGPQRLNGNVQGCIVVCPEMADESNLGAIARNAAALGASAVAVASGTGADPYSRKAIRASAGSIFRIPVFESPDLGRDLLELRDQGFAIVGACPGSDAIALDQVSLPSNLLLLFGSEGSGLSEQWSHFCDVKVKIPMANGADSLNVACSSAIFLYELLR